MQFLKTTILKNHRIIAVGGFVMTINKNKYIPKNQNQPTAAGF